MGRLRIVNKNDKSNYTMTLKENINIARAKRYKKLIGYLAIFAVLELIVIILGIIKLTTHIKVL